MNKTLNMRKSKIEEVNNILNKNYELTYEDLLELVDAYNKNKDIRKIVKKKTKIKVEKKKKENNVDKEAIKVKNREYYLKNRERLKKRSRDLYANDSKHRENHKHMVKCRYEKKRDEILTKRREYYKNNPQYFKEYFKNYYRNNKEKYGVNVVNEDDFIDANVENELLTNEEFKNYIYENENEIVSISVDDETKGNE